MSYEPGDLQIATDEPVQYCYDCEDGSRPGHVHRDQYGSLSYDSRAKTENAEYLRGPVVFFLPHSCDEWIIGGVAEAEALIRDLQAAIEKHLDRLPTGPDDQIPGGEQGWRENQLKLQIISLEHEVQATREKLWALERAARAFFTKWDLQQFARDEANEVKRLLEPDPEEEKQ